MRHGSPAFYAVEHRDFDRLTDTKRWGRYFEHMTRHRKAEGEAYNPLQDMIDKLRRQEAQRSITRRLMNWPCTTRLGTEDRSTAPCRA